MRELLAIQQRDLEWETWSQDLIAERGLVHWKTLISSDVTASDSLTVGLAELRPGEKLNLHHHAQAEVYYILEGTGMMTVGEQQQVVEAGTAIFILGNAVHGIANNSDSRLQWLYVFPADSFRDINYIFDEQSS